MREIRKKEKGMKTSLRAAKGDDCTEVYEYGVVPRASRERITGTNSCDRTIEPHPDDAKGYYNRGRAYQRRGDYLNAIGNYDKAIALDPRLAWAYYHRGLAHGDQGNRRQQVKDLQAAAGLGLGMALEILTVNRRTGK